MFVTEVVFLIHQINNFSSWAMYNKLEVDQLTEKLINIVIKEWICMFSGKKGNDIITCENNKVN